MSNRVGPETNAILRGLAAIQQELAILRTAMIGQIEPKSIMQRGGLFLKQASISKASTFTDTEIPTDGFNLVQISTDGDLTDVSYKVRRLDGSLSEEFEASLTPHVPGHTLGVLVTNDTAETGKTVYIDRYLAPWTMLSAIQHGTPQRGGGLLTEARFTPIAKGRIFNTVKATATNFFATDLSVTNTPALFRILIAMNVATVLSARITYTGTTVVLNFNGGSNLNADAAYMFDVLLRSGDTINFRHSDAGNVTVLYMLIDEIPAATQ